MLHKPPKKSLVLNKLLKFVLLTIVTVVAMELHKKNNHDQGLINSSYVLEPGQKLTSQFKFRLFDILVTDLVIVTY